MEGNCGHGKGLCVCELDGMAQWNDGIPFPSFHVESVIYGG